MEPKNKEDRIYKHMPGWVCKTINKIYCKKCNNVLDKKDIIACGLREKQKSQFFYIEIKCHICYTRSIVPFPNREDIISVRSLGFWLLDRAKKYNRIYRFQKSQSTSRSSITKEEVDVFLKMLHETTDHDEFMKNIGITPTQPQQKKAKSKSTKKKTRKRDKKE